MDSFETRENKWQNSLLYSAVWINNWTSEAFYYLEGRGCESFLIRA